MSVLVPQSTTRTLVSSTAPPVPFFSITHCVQPQNILGMLAEGVRDCGFAGADWVNELGVHDRVVEVLDTEMDPVRIVAAAPDPEILTKGGLGEYPCVACPDG